jgi:MFS family permease
VVAAVLGARTLLPTDHSSIRAEPALAKRNGRRPTPRHIWLLAALAFALMLTEGVANDWSTLAARDGLNVSASVAALTYGAFAGAMTVGRFVADRVSAARGAVAIVRYGSALAVVALAIVVASPWIGLTIFGWALLGIGLSGTIPQLFSGAGHFDPATSGSNVARVAGVGYLGMLAGPAVIGPLTHVVAIQHAFVLPLALCVVVVFCARAVTSSNR